jgi:preprotein translocase subunit SecD
VRAAWLVLVAVLAVAGCGDEVTGTPAKDDSPRVGPVDLVVPIEMYPVVEDGSAGTTRLPDPEGAQLTLAEPIMTVERLDSAEMKLDPNTGGWILNIDMTDQDAKTFGDWTTAHTGERLAMVIDDEVVVAPEIQGAITGGEVQISGNFTRDEIEKLLDKLTGRG